MDDRTFAIAMTTGRVEDVPTDGLELLRTDFVGPGEPLVLDPTRPAVQGPGGVAVLMRPDEMAPHPTMVAAAVLCEARRAGERHTARGHLRWPLFLLSAVRYTSSLGHTHVLSVSALRRIAERVDDLADGIRRSGTEGVSVLARFLFRRGPVAVVEMACLSDAQCAYTTMAVAAGLTTGRWQIPTGEPEGRRSREALLAVVHGGLGQWHLDQQAFSICATLPRTRCTVWPMDDRPHGEAAA